MSNLPNTDRVCAIMESLGMDYVKMFYRGDCERAARSFCSQVNGRWWRQYEKVATTEQNVYYVFFKRDQRHDDK